MFEKGVTKNILQGDLKIYKGAIFENIIADAFSKNGKKLYYYKKDSSLEIDFVTCYDEKINAIEVKATNGNSKSLKEITSNDKYNVGFINGILTLPHYMAFLIKD